MSILIISLALKEFKSKKIEILNESKFISYSRHDYEVWDHTLNKLAFEENNLNKESTTSIFCLLNQLIIENLWF